MAIFATTKKFMEYLYEPFLFYYLPRLHDKTII